MKKVRYVKYFVLVATLIFVIACGSGKAATPAPDLEATMGAAIAETKAAQQAAQPVQPAQPQVDLQATVDAQVQLTLAAQQAAQPVPEQPVPEQPVPEQPAPEQPAVEVPPADSSGTGEAAMAQLVQELYDSHRLSIKEGEYIKLDDFNNSVYKDRTHEWWRAGTGIQTSDFVLRADVAWRGDANPSASGCGFMYSGLAMDDYHLSVVSTEGIVHTYRSRGGKVIEMKGGTYSKPLAVSSGTAEIMLILDDKQMSFFVNGEEVVRFKDTYFNSGSIGYAINSYTPKGINCQFTNVEMWKIY
jgi:hypothetical protein